MNNLPITLCLFTSTKGHFGCRDLYQTTLDHWDKQVPLSSFGERIAHLKVSPGDEAIALDMTQDLAAYGFHVLHTTADWQRGLVHGAAYLSDQCTVSREPRVYGQPYFLFLEDDSPVVCRGTTLENLLLQSCDMLSKNHEMLSARVMRRGDDKGPVVNHLQPDPRFFWSQHFNFQPAVLRSLDYYRLCMMLEANQNLWSQVQCEALWAAIFGGFSRSPYKHLVWEVDFAETIHLGLPDYEQRRVSLVL